MQLKWSVGFSLTPEKNIGQQCSVSRSLSGSMVLDFQVSQSHFKGMGNGYTDADMAGDIDSRKPTSGSLLPHYHFAASKKN
jgi:hypothetical protein